MKRDKFFDGMTFVHSFNSIKKRTEQLEALFEKTQSDFEATDEEFWDLQIKVAELKDKFIYVYSGVDYDAYLFYDDVDEEGNYVWTYDFNHDICYEDNGGVINKLEKLNAPEEFINKFLNVYHDLCTTTDLAF